MRSTGYLEWAKKQYEKMDRLREEQVPVFDFITSAVAPDESRLRKLFEEPAWRASTSQDRDPWGAICGRLRKGNYWGHPDLLDAIAAQYGFDRNGVVVTGGASLALFLVFKTLLKPGDRIVVESPSYDPLRAVPLSLGARPDSLIRRPPDYGIDFDDLRRLLLAGGFRLVVLTNLHNPTGAVISDDEIDQLSALAEEFDLTVVFDEVFRDLGPPDPGQSSLPKPAANRSSRFVSINSLTKAYGFGFLRCAWILASPDTTQRIIQTQIIVENVGSPLTQGLASIVVDGIVNLRIEAYGHAQKHRSIVRSWAAGLGEGRLTGRVPDYGCLYFPRIAGLNDADEFARQLEARRVFVVPGMLFDAPDHVRVGFAGFVDNTVLEDGLQIFTEELDKLGFR